MLVIQCSLYVFLRNCFIFIVGVVVWDDENTAKRAFANMGTKFTPAEDGGISMLTQSLFLAK